jgi:hypothetical protein
MNPNSQNQMWSKWTMTVTPGVVRNRPFENVRENIARFMRKGFGSGSEMRLTRNGQNYVVEVRTEGHPAHDPGYVSYMTTNIHTFFVAGFGLGTVCKTEVKVEAGSMQDGKPAEQLMMLPPLTLGD